MDGIRVVAALVRCAADLLLCNDIDTDHLRFTDAEECRNALPAIISRYRHPGAPDEVVMGRCRFVAGRAPQNAARPTHHIRPQAARDIAEASGLEPRAAVGWVEPQARLRASIAREDGRQRPLGRAMAKPIAPRGFG